MPKSQKREKNDQDAGGEAQVQASQQEQNEPDAGDQPQAQGPQQGQGSGSGTPASGDGGGRTWTRGDDPEDAAEQLRMANRGSTGGELNQNIPQRTPQQGDESPQDPNAYQSGEDVESQE